MIVWLIATASSEITEAQIEWVKDEREVPRTCGRLEARNLPVRLGLTGLGMTEKEVAEHIGKPSHEDGFGWKFWFSQRFLKNARGLEELELNWVGLKFKDGRVDRGLPRSRATLKGALDCDTPRNRTSRRHFRPRT